MPLKFEEPEKVEKKEPAAARAVKKPETKVGAKKTGGKSRHRRVYTTSSYYFAKVKVTVVEATGLPGKKNQQPFCKVYLGSKPFTTSTQKKGDTLNPTWGDEFEDSVDRDETIQFKIYDHRKLSRNLDVQKDIPPIGKKKLTVKTIARRDIVLDEWYNLVGGGKLHVILDIKLVKPQPGAVHTKFFNYPTWMNDKYGVNVQEPDEDAIIMGLSTLTRYTIRWVRNQRGIVNLLADDEDEEEEEEDATVSSQCDALDNLEFELIDVGCSYHNKCLQMVVAYHWKEKLPPVHGLEDEFGVANVLNVKIFSRPGPFAGKKKQIHSYKPCLPEYFQKDFKLLSVVTEEVVKDAQTFLNDEGNKHRLMKMIILVTDITHHSVLFYYR